MATPAYQFNDPTKGLTLVKQGGENREQTRFLFTAGDVIDPDRKFQISTLRHGGEEVPSPCLRRTPNYIPRCVFTPLEKWFEPLGIRELAGDNMQHLVTLNEQPLPELPIGMPPTQFFRAHQPPVGLEHFPGEALPLIIEVVGYRGVKEIESLRGKEDDAQFYQGEFFPADFPLPIELRLIETRIREVSARSDTHRRLGDEKLFACDQFRRWAQRRINVEHGLLRTRKEHQHTYSYSPLAPQLLAQLEMSAQDSGSEATQLAQAIVREFIAAQSAPVAVGAIDVETIVKTVLLAQQAIQPQPVLETKAEYVCEGCGKSFDTSQGLVMHSARWCEAKKTE